MTGNTLLYKGQVVQALSSAVFHEGNKLEDITGLIKMIIEQDMWQERMIPATGEVQRYTRFIEFLRGTPPNGLGSDLKAISRLCAAVETQEAREALALLEEVTQQGGGAPQGNNNASKTSVDNIHSSTGTERPTGTSQSQALRRLRTHRPDLHARVNAGDLSPHAAMIEAGFRRKTMTVPVEPQAAAAALRRHFTPDELTAIIAALGEALLEVERLRREAAAGC